MKPIVICHPGKPDKEIEAINALFNAGLEILHVRKPAFSQEALTDFLENIDGKFHKRIVPHSHLDLVVGKNLRGIHFTPYNKHLIYEYNNYALPKSITSHSMSELINLSTGFIYAFLSPVFESISKEGYGPAINRDVLKKYLTKPHHVPVLALGGIDSTTVDIAKEIGFDGVVLHGHLWTQFEDDGDVDGVVKRYIEVSKKW